MNGTVTWWQMNLPSGSVTFGEQKAAMLGYPDSDFKHYQDFVNLVHPTDMGKTMQAMREHLEWRAPFYETTYRIRAKSGEYINFYDCGQVIKRDGENITVIGFVLKVDDGLHALQSMSDFKNMLVEGKPSVMDLVSKLKNQT